jgi:hypothetical protein
MVVCPRSVIVDVNVLIPDKMRYFNGLAAEDVLRSGETCRATRYLVGSVYERTGRACQVLTPPLLLRSNAPASSASDFGDAPEEGSINIVRVPTVVYSPSCQMAPSRDNHLDVGVGTGSS